MNVEEIRAALRNPAELQSSGFTVASEICRAFAAEPESQDVHELILRALEHVNQMNGAGDIILSLARERGLFPYLPEERLDIKDQIAYEFHRPPGLGDQGIVFHEPQARVYWQIMSGQNIALSAPTSFGKSLIIDAIVLSQRFRNILIIVPTLALMDETRRRLVQLGAGYKVLTHTNQARADRNIYVMTQERALELPDVDEIDFFVIDEFYKLSPQRGDDDRANTLNHVFYKLATAGKQFYMLGPSVRAIPEQLSTRFECKFLYEPYHTVVSELHEVKADGDELAKVTEVIEQADGPSIVYCRSPNKAAIVAARLGKERTKTIPDELQMAADWLASEYHEDWHLVTALRAGVGVHHGRIPRSLSQYVIRAFETDLIDALVCTSSLIEGVNTKAKNVVILDDTISKEKFDYFTFNNIRGRSGRMFKHFVGHVYLFHPPPQESLPYIDVPSITQSDDASDSLLLQLDNRDLVETSAERIRTYQDQRVLSLETIRANEGVDPEAQLAVAETITQSPSHYAAMLGWKGYPKSYDQLLTVCDLIWQHFNGLRLGAASVLTASQLAYRINRLRDRPAIRTMIEEQLTFMRTRDPSAPADRAVQNVLDFLRLWPGFHFPRLSMAISRIQQEVLPRLGYPAGDFNVFASQVENLFLDPIVPALEEYGLPIQIGRKIQRLLRADGDLDLALERLKNLKGRTLTGLTPFESILMENAVDSL